MREVDAYRTHYQREYSYRRILMGVWVLGTLVKPEQYFYICKRDRVASESSTCCRLKYAICCSPNTNRQNESHCTICVSCGENLKFPATSFTLPVHILLLTSFFFFFFLMHVLWSISCTKTLLIFAQYEKSENYAIHILASCKYPNLW